MNKPITKKEWMEYLEKTWDAAQEEALAQQEQKPVPWESFFNRYCPWLEQPEQDVPATRFGNMGPVGWLESPDGVFRANPLYKIKFPSQLLSWQIPVFAALAEPEEPVAKVELMVTGGSAGLATRIVEIDDHLRERLRPGQLLYTAPPQRKPLTDGELADLWYKQSTDWMEFGRAIEAAHGIKGEA